MKGFALWRIHQLQSAFRCLTCIWEHLWDVVLKEQFLQRLFHLHPVDREERTGNPLQVRKCRQHSSFNRDGLRDTREHCFRECALGISTCSRNTWQMHLMQIFKCLLSNCPLKILYFINISQSDKNLSFFTHTNLNLLWIKGWWTFAVKGQTANIFRFVDYKVPVAIIQLCFWHARAAMGNM